MRILTCCILPIVMAVDVNFFSDETCGTPSTEIKGRFGAGANAGDQKITLSAATISVTNMYQCQEFGEEFTIKSDADGAVEYKYNQGRLTKCDEYGSMSMELFTKNYKECKYLKSADLQEEDSTITIGGWTSMCQPYWAGNQQAVELLYNPGMNWITNAPYYQYAESKPQIYYKIGCNPAPGDVWAIILSTLAIVFAFAGIGLAVVAKGK